MSAQETIRKLLASAAEPAERKAARIAWVKDTTAKWREAMRERDERCTEAVEHLDEADFNRLFEAKQVKVEAIRAELRAVADHDRWPREMHFGCV